MKIKNAMIFPLLFATALTGCGNRKPSFPAGDIEINITDEEIAAYKSRPVTISFWNPITGPDSGYLQGLVTTWNNKFGKAININNSSLDEDDHYQRILTSFSDNSTADLCIVHKSRLATYKRSNKLRDMTDLLEDAGIEESQYIPAVWKGGKFDEKMYALPYDLIPTVLYYNKLLIPEGYSESDITSDSFTFENMYEMMKAAYVHAPRSSQRTYGMAFNYAYTEEPFLTVLYSLGGELVNKDNPTQPLFNSSNGFEATKAIESLPFTLTSQGRKTSSDSGSDHRVIFSQGRALFTMDGLWSTEALVKHNDKVDTGLTFLPKVSAEAARLGYSDSHTFVTFANKNVSAHRDGAIKLLLKYFVHNSAYWMKSGKVAARIDTTQDEDYKSLMWSFVSDEMTNICIPESIYTYNAISGVLGKTISKICEGKGSNHSRYSDSEIQSMLNQGVQEAKEIAERL